MSCLNLSEISFLFTNWINRRVGFRLPIICLEIRTFRRKKSVLEYSFVTNLLKADIFDISQFSPLADCTLRSYTKKWSESILYTYKYSSPWEFPAEKRSPKKLATLNWLLCFPRGLGAPANKFGYKVLGVRFIISSILSLKAS